MQRGRRGNEDYKEQCSAVTVRLLYNLESVRLKHLSSRDKEEAPEAAIKAGVTL